MIDFARSFLNIQEVDLILAVPLHNAKWRQRQFNQAQILAQYLATAFSKNAQPKLIARVKFAAAQAGLSRIQRFKNVRGAFRIRHPQILSNKRILLVDDIFTTGATADECAKILLKAGAKKVDVFTLAGGAPDP